MDAARAAIRYSTSVDGVGWAGTSYGKPFVNTDASDLVSLRDPTRIHASCGRLLSSAACEPVGATLGRHTVLVQAHLAGATIDIPPVTVEIDLQCPSDGGVQGDADNDDGGSSAPDGRRMRRRGHGRQERFALVDVGRRRLGGAARVWPALRLAQCPAPSPRSTWASRSGDLGSRNRAPCRNRRVTEQSPTSCDPGDRGATGNRDVGASMSAEVYSRAMATTQSRIGSGYSAYTTAREVLAGRTLDGVVAVVTGGYAGVGLETTRALADAGATVVVPARSLDKARAALAAIPRTEVAPLDLIDPASVDAFVAHFLSSRRPIHILINNAGIMAPPLERDARGYESQLATNHLGHFQLTMRLWPALRQAGGARVVSLSSRGHRRGGVDFDDPHFQSRPYDKWVAYGQSKTANALFAMALDARGQSQGVRAFSVHPGAILTELVRSLPDDELSAIKSTAAVTGIKNVEQGAATSVWCATSAQLEGMGGVYCEDVDIADAVAADLAEPRGVRPWAMDAGFAERLWMMSEGWTRVRFGG